MTKAKSDMESRPPCHVTDTHGNLLMAHDDLIVCRSFAKSYPHALQIHRGSILLSYRGAAGQMHSSAASVRKTNPQAASSEGKQDEVSDTAPLAASGKRPSEDEDESEVSHGHEE